MSGRQPLADRARRPAAERASTRPRRLADPQQGVQLRCVSSCSGAAVMLVLARAIYFLTPTSETASLLTALTNTHSPTPTWAPSPAAGADRNPTGRREARLSAPGLPGGGT